MNPGKLKYVDRTLETARQTMHALLPITAYNEAVAGPAYQALNQITLRYLRMAYADICEALKDVKSFTPEKAALSDAPFQVPSPGDFLPHFDKVIASITVAITNQLLYDSRDELRNHAVMQVEIAADELSWLIIKRLTAVQS